MSAPAGSKAARTELVRILIAKDIFDGCEGATKAVYRALVAAARQWATEEQVTAVWPGFQPSVCPVTAHVILPVASAKWARHCRGRSHL